MVLMVKIYKVNSSKKHQHSY